MGTYAEYRIWVGVKNEELEDFWDHAFISRVREAWQEIPYNDLPFTAIAMHGETIGIGVEVFSLSWEDEIKDANNYDPSIPEKVLDIHRRVIKAFQDMKLPLVPKVYHHIDLGG